MEDWGLQAIRYVYFVASAEGLKAGELYRAFVGEEADSVQNNRNFAPSNPYLSLAQGEVNNDFYQVVVQPGRLEFHFGCPDRPSAGPWAWRLRDGLQKIENNAESLDRIIKVLPMSTRLAIHLQLLRNLTTQEEASEFLLSRLGWELWPHVTDLHIQMNRPSTTLSGLPINRVMQFATSSVQEVAMQIGPGSDPSMRTIHRFLAQFLVDVNTIPDGLERPAREATKVFREMRIIAEKLAKGGALNALMVQ